MPKLEHIKVWTHKEYPCESWLCYNRTTLFNYVYITPQVNDTDYAKNSEEKHSENNDKYGAHSSGHYGNQAHHHGNRGSQYHGNQYGDHHYGQQAHYQHHNPSTGLLGVYGGGSSGGR